jgi:fermentation-respiration switch protein FrsA (DUF1100 family)
MGEIIMTGAGKKWVRAGLLTAGAAGIAAISHSITNFLVRVAIDRDCPAPDTLARMAIRGSTCPREFLDAMRVGAENLEALPHQVVQLKAKDGTALIGHWFAGENPERIIVAMHGWRSGWNFDFGMAAPFLLERGCAILFPEQRGQGGSGGEHMGLGALERHDCLQWINWVNDHRNKDKLPIYLAGVSMGATTVLLCADMALPDTVKGIIADCGFTSAQAICKHVVEHNLHLSYAIRSHTADKLCKKRNRAGLRACSAIDSLARSKVPVLFIHGSDDCFVPVSMTYENYKACRSPKTLFIVPGADHGMSYYTDREGYEKALLRFWALNDAP